MAAVALPLSVGGAARAQAPKPAAPGPAEVLERRVARLVAGLTAEEAIDLISGNGLATRAVPRLGIPAFSMSDGPAGVRSPAPAVAYASGIALAASWDETLAERVGVQLGRDARARGVQFLLGPGVNLYRSPLNGRNFEYLGEDPVLAARLAAAFVRGVHVGAVMSSYNSTNGQPMSASAALTAVLEEQWGFDGVLMSDWGATRDGLGAASAGLDLEMPSGSFMNRATLEPALGDGRLARAVIDDKVRRLRGLAARFGWLDTTAPDFSISHYNQPGREVARQSALEGAVLLRNTRRLLPLDPQRIETLAVLGPLAHPGAASGGGSSEVPAHQTVSLLMGSSDALGSGATVTYAPGLPPLRSLAMWAAFTTEPNGGDAGLRVEEFADPALRGEPVGTRIEWTLAKGSPAFLGDPDGLQLHDHVPPARIRARREARVHADRLRRYERWTGWFQPEQAGAHTVFVQSAGGYRLWIDDAIVLDSSPLAPATLRQAHLSLGAGPHKVVFEEAPGNEPRQPFFRVGLFADDRVVEPLALELAARADAVVVSVGFEPNIETEGSDREFGLPPGQDRLIREVAAVNRNVIVVLTSGGSVDVSPWLGDVEALIAGWYPGQEGGAALARLLLGQANFSGRLPISWERRLRDNPSAANYHHNDPQAPNRIVYREGIFSGYRGHQKQSTKPLFPFGFGLSYASFRYSNLAVRALPPAPASAADARRPLYEVSFELTNTGQRKGADVAQIYVAPPPSPVPRPKRELEAFARVELAPGETRHVSLSLDARALTYFDVEGRHWRAEPGKYGIELGRSSEAIELRTELNLPRPLSLDVKD